MRGTCILLVVVLTVGGRARGATRDELTAAVSRAADRLTALRTLDRGWEDAPALVGLLLVAAERERVDPGSGRRWIDLADAVVGAGEDSIWHGDSAGYAQAALELYRTAPPGDAARRQRLLSATRGPFGFAERAMHLTPADGPPMAAWWLEGGYGTRFWVDDLFTLPPWLAMRGSSLDSLPADPQARDLAYEWVESYVFDHRPEETTTSESAAVPSRRPRRGPLLWDPSRELFRHDAAEGWDRYWGRGNGWAAWGLARCARFLDTPYGGGRYDEVLGRTSIRELLARQAGSLVRRRADDGGWPTDLENPGACPESESSATGLIAFMLAKGVNEGWLDRETFTPIVLKSLALLLGRLDSSGVLAGIQPPGTGPDCGVVASNDPGADVSYGVGALLLAASEALKFPDAALATMAADAARPVDRAVLPRTWVVVLPESCDRPDVMLTNRGTNPVRARLDPAPGTGADSSSTLLPPGGSAALAVASSAERPGPVVARLRADGDLDVRPRANCGVFEGVPDSPRRVAWPSRRAGEAVPLWTAQAGGESSTFETSRDSVLTYGVQSFASVGATVLVTIAAADGTLLSQSSLLVPAGGAAFETRFVTAGARLTVSNRSEGSSIVPLVFER